MIDGATKTLKLLGYDVEQLKQLDEELLLAPAVVPPAPPFPPCNRVTVPPAPAVEPWWAPSWSRSGVGGDGMNLMAAPWNPSLFVGELFSLTKKIEDVREEFKQRKNDDNEKLEQVMQELQQCKHELKQVKQELQQYKHDNNETLDQMRQESHQCKNDDTEKLEQKLELQLCKHSHNEQSKQLDETMKCNYISYKLVQESNQRRRVVYICGAPSIIYDSTI